MDTTDLPQQTRIAADQAPQTSGTSTSATLREARHEAAALLDDAGQQAGALAQRGARAIRDTSLSLRDSAVRVGDSTALYVKDEPLKAILMAAATGAALMALVGLLSRSRDRT
jgi:ElaB/YqjD/DUF883 family membrane-anchored ribosome-binding protein